MKETARPRAIAFVVTSRVIGGHEIQTRALVDTFASHGEVAVFLNRSEQLPLFSGLPGRIDVCQDLFLSRGRLGQQVLHGLKQRRNIQRLLAGYDHIVVCAGTVNAGISTSVALAGRSNVSLYLPFFYDRRTLWGKAGGLYNRVLGCFGVFYRNIITINPIQARLIRGFMHRPTFVIPNLIADLPAAVHRRKGRLLFIGRLDRQKRVPQLLEWLDFAGNPFNEIVVIGEGPEGDMVAATAARLQHIGATLLGWKSISEQTELIDSADVLLLNSMIEGEPLVIREAHRRGIVVVARDIAAIRGITLRKNRFSSQASLHSALREAGLGQLRTRGERSHDEVAQRRERAAGKFFAHHH